jgi:hypothetical protein
MAEPCEAQGIPTGPATGVEGCRLIRQHRQEATVERRNVDSDRFVKDGSGVLFEINNCFAISTARTVFNDSALER